MMTPRTLSCQLRRLRSSSVSTEDDAVHAESIDDLTLSCEGTLSKDWTNVIYAFYQKTPDIEEIRGRRAHTFTCSKPGCAHRVRRFLDTKDRLSTGNMYKHTRVCWGSEAIEAAKTYRNEKAAREPIAALGRSGTLPEAFGKQGARMNIKTYSITLHTREQIRSDLALIDQQLITYLGAPQGRDCPMGH